MEELQTMLSKYSGVPVEITIRGEKEFTFSFEGKNETALEKIVNFFKKEAARITYVYDSECNYSAIYLQAK